MMLEILIHNSRVPKNTRKKTHHQQFNEVLSSIEQAKDQRTICEVLEEVK